VQTARSWFFTIKPWIGPLQDRRVNQLTLKQLRSLDAEAGWGRRLQENGSGHLRKYSNWLAEDGHSHRTDNYLSPFDGLPQKAVKLVRKFKAGFGDFYFFSALEFDRSQV